LPRAFVSIVWIDKGHFLLFVVQLQQDLGIHCHNIIRDVLRVDDNGSLDLMFKFDKRIPFFELNQALKTRLVYLRDVNIGRIRDGTFAQKLEIPERGHGQAIKRWRFEVDTKTAALETP